MKGSWLKIKTAVIHGYYRFLIYLITKLRNYRLYNLATGGIYTKGIEYKGSYILNYRNNQNGTLTILYKSPRGGFNVETVNTEDFTMGLVTLPNATIGKRATDSVNNPRRVPFVVHPIGEFDLDKFTKEAVIPLTAPEHWSAERKQEELDKIYNDDWTILKKELEK